MRRGATLLAAIVAPLPLLSCTQGSDGRRPSGVGVATVIAQRPAATARRPVRRTPRIAAEPMRVADAFLRAELLLERSPSARGAQRVLAGTATAGLARRLRSAADGRRGVGPAGTVAAVSPVAAGPGWAALEATVAYIPAPPAAVELELLRRGGVWRVADMRVGG